MSQFSAAAWANASDTAGEQQDNPAPDPGTYRACLSEGTRAFTSKNGKDLVKFAWTIVDGPARGYEFNDMKGFQSPGAVNALKATCARLGVDTNVSTLEDLNGRVRAQIGDWYEIEVVQNGQYRNVYVQGKISPPDPGDTSSFVPAETQAKADEVPW